MSNQGDIAPSLPSVATVDTLDLQHLIDAWVAEKTMPVWRALIAHIDAHVAAQVAAAVASIDLNGIKQYRMQMAGISTAALGYWTETDTVAPKYDTPALRDVAKLYAKYAALSAQAAAPVVADLHAQIMNLTCHVENCIFNGTTAEMCYKQGHRDARHAAAELVASQPSPAPVAMTDEQIELAECFRAAFDTPIARRKWDGGEAGEYCRKHFRAILAAQQEAV